MNRMLVLGTEIDRISSSGAVERALSCMEGRRGAYVVTPNTEIVLSARKCPELREAIRASSLSIPDSVGIGIACRILGTPIEERIPGIDFALSLFPEMAKREMSVFLFGAREGVAERAACALCLSFPGLRIAGTADGYSDLLEEEALIERIDSASPDLMLICLGSPKQELWMHRNASRLRVGLMAGLGGALDVFSGDLRRAPPAWRNAGMEWLYRLLNEPQRIKRVSGLPRIVFAAARNRIGGNGPVWKRES